MTRDWWNKEFRTLVTLGASMTAGGWASSPDRCWARLLTGMINDVQRVPMQLINVGIGANVISTKSPMYPHSGRPAASERLEKHVIAHNPDLLTIDNALTDVLGGTPVDLFCSELQDVILRVRRHIQPLILLLSPYYICDFKREGGPWRHATPESLRRFADAIEELARQTDCLYVDVLSIYHEADWLVHHDGVHANDLGHRVIANAVFNVLAAHCSGLALETKELEKHIPPWRDETSLQQDALRCPKDSLETPSGG